MGCSHSLHVTNIDKMEDMIINQHKQSRNKGTQKPAEGHKIDFNTLQEFMQGRVAAKSTEVEFDLPGRADPEEGLESDALDVFVEVRVPQHLHAKIKQEVGVLVAGPAEKFSMTRSRKDEQSWATPGGETHDDQRQLNEFLE
mmetsp:Transcript_43110/g.100474  ORF Transcript_43110/g.100474 Transcript_43110/m.100474 type:complete len:142 (-) Transcript_43110:41-466(-)